MMRLPLMKIKIGGGSQECNICAYPYFEILDPPLIILVNSPYNRVRPIRGKLSRI